MLKDKFCGALLGLAIGDALGAPIEFLERDTYEPISHYRSGGPFNLAAGQWTDDTSLALCLGKSLLEQNGFDPKDLIARFYRWYKEGYMSCTGHCFDIGNTTKAALMRFEESGSVFSSGINDPASNGSIMRLAPVALFNFLNLNSTLFYAAESSRVTHAPLECIEASKALAFFIHKALCGLEKNEILSFNEYDLLLESEEIRLICKGSYKKKLRKDISAKGMASTCLEAALWAFYQTNNFLEGALLAVNLGEDSDTTGAVYGQIAGAFYGEKKIESHLIHGLWDHELIKNMAIDLYKKVNPYFYEGVNPTVDLIVINPQNEILLIKRSQHSNACPGMYAIPGGFIDSHSQLGEYWVEDLESPHEAAIRELEEETNLKIDSKSDIIFVGEFEGNHRDPRDNKISWSKSHAFVCKLSDEIFQKQKDSVRGMDDADEAQWIKIEEVKKMKLAFDHHQILERALEKING